jgi:hypothetical protein
LAACKNRRRRVGRLIDFTALRAVRLAPDATRACGMRDIKPFARIQGCYAESAMIAASRAVQTTNRFCAKRPQNLEGHNRPGVRRTSPRQDSLKIRALIRVIRVETISLHPAQPSADETTVRWTPCDLHSRDSRRSQGISRSRTRAPGDDHEKRSRTPPALPIQPGVTRSKNQRPRTNAPKAASIPKSPGRAPRENRRVT